MPKMGLALSLMLPGALATLDAVKISADYRK